MPVPQRDCLTFLHQMVGQAVDAALGELLAAGLAGVLVAVACILELLPADEELENQLIRLAAHCLWASTRVPSTPTDKAKALEREAQPQDEQARRTRLAHGTEDVVKRGHDDAR